MKKHLLFQSQVLIAIIAIISGLVFYSCSDDEFIAENESVVIDYETTRASIDFGSWFCTNCGFWVDGTKCWVCNGSKPVGSIGDFPTLDVGPWYESPLALAICIQYRLKTPGDQHYLYYKSWDEVVRLIVDPNWPRRVLSASEVKAICDKYVWDHGKEAIVRDLNGNVIYGIIEIEGVRNACDAAFESYSKAFGPLQP